MENLKNNRKAMQDALVRALGMEHSGVIWFFKLCEEYEDNEWNNECLHGLMSALLDLVQYESELE